MSKMPQAESLQGVQAVVASPIFDAADQVAGVVYGCRSQGLRTRDIGPLDAQIVQLLAAIVGSGLVRVTKEAEANRMRIAMHAAAEAEQTRIQNLFGRYVPPLVAEQRLPASSRLAGVFSQLSADPAAAFFGRACAIGVSAGCENQAIRSAGRSEFRHVPPRLIDYPIVLREGKGPLPDRTAVELLTRACNQGWAGSCEELGRVRANGGPVH